MLNKEVFHQIQEHQKRILVVTKYWDKVKTLEIISESQKDYPDIYYGIGENRIEQIIKKDLSRQEVHFIGNIQSKKIPDIAKHSSTIHSLDDIKHARLIEKQGLDIQAFIQIHLDPEKEAGVEEADLQSFLDLCKDFQYLKIIGISGMGKLGASEQEKRSEFKKLKRIRNKYIPDGLISAGTSVDYKIALDEGIDIVRIGQKSVV